MNPTAREREAVSLVRYLEKWLGHLMSRTTRRRVERLLKR